MFQKKKKSLLSKDPKDGKTSSQKSANQAEKLEKMRHAQRYQKNRKKKQLELKKSLHESPLQDELESNQAHPKADTLKKRKGTDFEKEKGSTPSKKLKYDLESLSPKTSTATSNENGLLAEKMKKVKKESKKSSPDDKNEAYVESTHPKKSRKNKYLHLAGKGKRMLTASQNYIENSNSLDKTEDMEINTENLDVMLKPDLKRKMEDTKDNTEMVKTASEADDTAEIKLPKKKKSKKKLKETLADGNFKYTRSCGENTKEEKI